MSKTRGQKNKQEKEKKPAVPRFGNTKKVERKPLVLVVDKKKRLGKGVVSKVVNATVSGRGEVSIELGSTLDRSLDDVPGKRRGRSQQPVASGTIRENGRGRGRSMDGSFRRARSMSKTHQPRANRRAMDTSQERAWKFSKKARETAPAHSKSKRDQVKPPMELTKGKRVSKQQARLINKARQALDPLNKIEKQPMKKKVPTRSSIDAMAAPRRPIRGGGKLVVDPNSLPTSNMTDEELMASAREMS